ncbi:hypothetical protein [Burkholderia metallica]|uniref:Uncharacterized protein n=1 Tax=Burkholderia metallica TaxID=488729 RepID=A0ABT8PN65_9BURK|nr:hypothetical protein [Burkholderia metallica]MDN7936507.1 hypothetical protein [Burkholderia metallica]
MQRYFVGISRSSVGIVAQPAHFVRISPLIVPAAAYAGGLSRRLIYVMISILIFMLPGGAHSLRAARCFERMEPLA